MSSSSKSKLLDETTVGAYLVERGVLPPGAVRARALAGGVSNLVLLAESGGVRVVLKQALARLRVADEWTADPARAQGEAAALRLLHRLTPGSVPAVLDDDPVMRTVAVAAAPEEWVNWRERLLDGVVEPWVADWLGRVLRRWHTATLNAELPAELERYDLFRQLRVDPYLGTSARRRPDLAAHLRRRADAMAERRRCLVSADYSPKNVLVGGGSGWVIDLEAAHRGDPAFDVAFLVTHLLLKAVHLPDHTGPLRACLTRFLDAYAPSTSTPGVEGKGADGPGADDPEHLCQLVGCLLLARVVGSSPATYLRPGAARQVERAAAEVLSSRPRSVTGEVWAMVVA